MVGEAKTRRPVVAVDWNVTIAGSGEFVVPFNGPEISGRPGTLIPLFPVKSLN